MNNSYLIELDGKYFKKGYVVYVVELCHKSNGRYFYIGQTGDKNYITARAPIMRLAAHLKDSGSATDNQVYKQLAIRFGNHPQNAEGAFSQATKDLVTEFLTKCDIKMHVNLVSEFSNSVLNHIHVTSRKQVELYEITLIDCMVKKFGAERIFNNISNLSYQDIPEANKWVSEVIQKI